HQRPRQRRRQAHRQQQDLGRSRLQPPHRHPLHQQRFQLVAAAMKARYIAMPASGRFAPWLPLVGLLGFIALWGLVTGLGLVRAAFLPTPGETARAMGRMIADGTLFREGWASLQRVLLAVGLSALVGIPIGILMGAFGKFEGLLKWLVFPFRSAPITAFIPVFMLFFGIEEGMKVWFLFFGTVVYII